MPMVEASWRITSSLTVFVKMRRYCIRVKGYVEIISLRVM